MKLFAYSFAFGSDVDNDDRLDLSDLAEPTLVGIAPTYEKAVSLGKKAAEEAIVGLIDSTDEEAMTFKWQVIHSDYGRGEHAEVKQKIDGSLEIVDEILVLVREFNLEEG